MKPKLYLSMIVTLMGMGQPTIGSDLKEEGSSVPASGATSSGGWGGWLTRAASTTYYNVTASTETEQNKFPEIDFSMLCDFSKRAVFYPISADDKNPQDVMHNRAFPFSTGTENTPSYYKGYWFIETIDYGSVGHTFLGVGKGFSSNATYYSSVNELTPYNFLKKLQEKNLRNGIFHKGTPFKGADGKTYMVYQFHSEPSAAFYITLTVGRFRVDDRDYLVQFQTRAEEGKAALQK